MKTIRMFALLMILLACVNRGYTKTPNPTTPSDDQVNAIAKQLYCPVCENIPLDVCPTQACAQWRELIREKLAAGWNEKEIKDYFVEQYGAHVLGAPPARGINWLVYIIPPVAVLAGVYILVRALLKVAMLHAMESGIERLAYREVAAEALAAEMPDAFDVVTCMEMLEHVPESASVVRACATLVKPGGWVFFSTINRNPKAFVLAIVGAEHVLKLLPKGTHEYARFIRPSELAQFVRKAALSVEEMKGMEYNPLTQRYWLPGDTSVNYLVACQRPG